MGISKFVKLFKTLRMEKGLTQRELAKELDIGAGSIYKYENDKMKPGADVLEKVKTYCNVHGLNETIDILNADMRIKPLVSNDINNKSSKSKGVNMDAQYIMDLQKARIDSLESELRDVKALMSNKRLEQDKFANIKADFRTTVNIKFGINGMQRQIESFDGLEPLAKKLKMTKSECSTYFDIGTWHKHEEHPCQKILDVDSATDISKYGSSLPMLWDTVAKYTTQHYINTPVVYHYNNVRVYTICYIHIIWGVSPVRCETKSQFLSQ